MMFQGIANHQTILLIGLYRRRMLQCVTPQKWNGPGTLGRPGQFLQMNPAISA
jgi:hypothetical protein